MIKLHDSLICVDDLSSDLTIGSRWVIARISNNSVLIVCDSDSHLRDLCFTISIASLRRSFVTRPRLACA